MVLAIRRDINRERYKRDKTLSGLFSQAGDAAGNKKDRQPDFPKAFEGVAELAMQKESIRLEMVGLISAGYHFLAQTDFDTDLAVVKTLAPFLRDADAAVRKVAADAFEKIGANLAEKNMPVMLGILSGLHSEETREKDPGIRASLQGAIDGLEKAGNAWIKKHPEKLQLRR